MGTLKALCLLARSGGYPITQYSLGLLLAPKIPSGRRGLGRDRGA